MFSQLYQQVKRLSRSKSDALGVSHFVDARESVHERVDCHTLIPMIRSDNYKSMVQESKVLENLIWTLFAN